MEFGFLPSTDLDTIDFSLPEGDDSILPGQASPDFKFYFGAARWGRKEWVGTLYPERLKESLFFDEYLKHFNYIELNAVFYQLPKADQVRIWAEKAKPYPDFKFTPKISREITHIRRLKNAQAATNNFIEVISEFGAALGPCFFQLSDNFASKHFDVLEEYLVSLPEDFKCNVEFRHPDWFEPEVFRRITDLLTDLNIGLIITDSAGRRDVVHTSLTTDSVHIRFNGYSNHPTDRQRMEAWRDKILNWKAKGIKEVYFTLNQWENDAFYVSQLTAREVFKDLLV
ncbi:DUF72 domain-containing protein [Paradesertivirga mongoliensis]|uniref:DUF72 domain-containing protein n=1 Tax=Paradesertivirga mongoliensis TaxID=2100740 RepID=A0ABW4ZQ16_9SPHI|nr:DUF72 domain-containing protein [Pedobacter mongoliensis]